MELWPRGPKLNKSVIYKVILRKLEPWPSKNFNSGANDRVSKRNLRAKMLTIVSNPQEVYWQFPEGVSFRRTEQNFRQYLEGNWWQGCLPTFERMPAIFPEEIFRAGFWHFSEKSLSSPIKLPGFATITNTTFGLAVHESVFYDYQGLEQ